MALDVGVNGMSRLRRVVNQSDTVLTGPYGIEGARVRSGAKIDRITLVNRAKPRSAELVTTIRQVDGTVDNTARADIMAWIREQYDARQGGMLIGLFATCYLGPPYVDHKLGLTHQILEHYSPAEDPGHPYNQTRGLVRSGAYAYIEIYSDGSIVPVRTDGTSVEFTPNP